MDYFSSGFTLIDKVCFVREAFGTHLTFHSYSELSFEKQRIYAADFETLVSEFD